MFPEIKLSDSISIPTYLLYLSVLYCFLVLYVVRRAHRRDESVTIALDLALIMMVGGFFGGRLVHVFYEMPQYYAQDWTRVFQFWQGGFVFYGGFLAALLGCVIFLWRRGLSFAHWSDFYAPVAALGYGLGRMSCFFAGCCYGRSCEAPWAMAFPWDPQHILRHPTQLYAVLWELGVFALLIFLERRRDFLALALGSSSSSRPFSKWFGRPGKLFFLWLLFHSVGRLMMEYYREDFRGDMILGFSISSWISFVLFAAAVAGLWSSPASRPAFKSKN